VPKTTIIDIAAASGVSVATVSRISNDKPDVAVETRERPAGHG
jgi:DNA-binding LacI/PurR family transcriptional regulator